MTLPEILVEKLASRSIMISTAESCTGGLIAKLITDISGSSIVFDRGFVTYSNQSKVDMLEVDEKTLEIHGAVSEECAREMTAGLRWRSGSAVCVATTGIAGPTGGSSGKPVGLIYAGFFIGEDLFVERLLLKGSRDDIRRQTANYCIRKVIDALA